MLNLHAPQPILPMLTQEFDVSATMAAFTIAISALAVGLAAPFAGAVSDRRGRKPVLVAASFGVAAPTLAASLSPNLETLFLCRLLQGLFIPAVFTAILAYIAEEWELSRRGSITGVYVTANVAGGFGGRFIAGACADLGDWRFSFVVLGLLALAGAVAVWWMLPPSRHFAPRAQRGGALAAFAFARHLRNRTLLAACLVGFAIMFSFTGLMTYVSFYLSGPPFGLGPAGIGAVFLTYALAAVSTPFAGRMIDRLGARSMLIVSATAMISGAALTAVPALPIVLVGLVLACGGMFTAQSSSVIFTTRSVAEGRSAAVGLYLTFYYAGGALGATIPGLAYDAAGWTGCVSVAVLATAAGAVVAFLAWRRSED